MILIKPKFLTLLVIFSVFAFCLSANTMACASHKLKSITINGSVAANQTFNREFDNLIFQLAPEGRGFKISILDSAKPSSDAHSDLSWLTLPLHGLTDRDILASDFRNQDNSKPNSGSVNRPQLTRKFVFARDAETRLNRYEQTNGASGLEEKPDGYGSLVITRLDLMNLGKGKDPCIRKMPFRVTLNWAE